MRVWRVVWRVVLWSPLTSFSRRVLGSHAAGLVWSGLAAGLWCRARGGGTGARGACVRERSRTRRRRPLAPAPCARSPPLFAAPQGILQEAVSRKEYWRLIDGQGRPPGVLGLWPSRAVTFLENHDTGACQRGAWLQAAPASGWQQA